MNAYELDYNTPQEFGAPAYEFPFEDLGDFSSFIVTRNFKQYPAAFLRDKLEGRYRPGTVTDREHAGATLIGTREPQTTVTGLFSFARSFAVVPRTQTDSSTLSLTKPNPSAYGTSEATGYSFVSTDSGAAIGIGYSYLDKTWINNQVYTRNAVSMSRTQPSGGTFTISYKASTTAALNWNDNEATLVAAINGLASVISDGITVTAVGMNSFATQATISLTLSVGSTTSLFTCNAASLTPAAAQTAFTLLQSSTTQTISIAYRGTLTAHGFSASGNVLVYRGGGSTYHCLLPPTTHWVAVDANTLAVSAAAPSGTVIGQLLRAYVPGIDVLGCKIISNFYLPGVTPGITTAADIPIPSPLINDVEFLTSVIANPTGFVDYNSRDLTRWRGGPIYQLDKIQINMADV